MKLKSIPLLYLLFLSFSTSLPLKNFAQAKNLKLVFIRHAERPENGDNLNCKGLNRSLLLPSLLYKKFGKPDDIYIPSIHQGDQTKRSRMFQTITPFAVKYNLSINSSYEEDDYKHTGKALLKEQGTVLIVWEHHWIQSLVSYLGVKTGKWPDDDYDSIWILTFPKGKAVLTKDKQGLKPGINCSF